MDEDLLFSIVNEAWKNKGDPKSDAIAHLYAKLNEASSIHTCGPTCRKTPGCAERSDLRATIERLRAALTAVVEQRKYLSSPYDTGWNDAIRWINQQVDAAMAGGGHG